MFVSRNNIGTDTAYIVSINYPDKIIHERGDRRGVSWQDPIVGYVKCLNIDAFEVAEGIKLSPGEGPIQYVLYRVDKVGQKAVTLKGPDDDIIRV